MTTIECRVQGKWLPEGLIKAATNENSSVNKRRIARNTLKNRGIKFPFVVTDIRITERSK